LQLGCKLPKELGTQVDSLDSKTCFDSNESDLGSGPTTSRRAVTARHQNQSHKMWDPGMHDWRNGWKGTVTREPLARHAQVGSTRKRSSAHKMTRWASQSRVTVSDDEDGEWDDVGECSNCRHQGISGTRCPVCEDTGFIHESVGVRRVWRERIQAAARSAQERVTVNIRRLVRIGKAGNELPEVGQVCLVLRGDERKDVGQECVVTKQSAARVHVSFRDANGRQATRLKHPASLVLLEDGLHLVQDARGCVWVKRETEGE
jgi:hypothetical protein